MITVILILFFATIVESTHHKTRPNIIFILADDLGFNDVSFHGSSQIPTPNIDALAYSGIILNRYYVTPLCTPSRSSLLTGKYPLRLGLQHDVLNPGEPRGLSLNETLLPEYLNDLGYKSHIIGKWHLGHFKEEYTPMKRGFASHVGYWTGFQDYYDHTTYYGDTWGLDMRRGMEVAWDLHGQYTTDVITSESIRIIENHDTKDPLFLYIPHLACHSSNSYNPLPAPDETVDALNHIENFKRRKYAAILTKLDESVGDVIKSLADRKMLENSIIVFSTDNGGAPEGLNRNYASNWPLRGAKYGVWEGGVRGVGVIWSPLLKKQQRVSNQLFHITDWLPTLYHAAGGDASTLKNLDGINLWKELSKNRESKRNEVLINLDDYYKPRNIFAIIVGKYKLLTGTWFEGHWDGWYGPSGDRSPFSYNFEEVEQSKAGIVFNSTQYLPFSKSMLKLRSEATLYCSLFETIKTKCNPLEEICLFDIINDPCERQNIASRHPEVVEAMLKRIEKHRKTAIPAANKPTDERSNPKFWDNTWTNFGDFVNIESREFISDEIIDFD